MTLATNSIDDTMSSDGSLEAISPFSITPTRAKSAEDVLSTNQYLYQAESLFSSPLQMAAI